MRRNGLQPPSTAVARHNTYDDVAAELAAAARRLAAPLALAARNRALALQRETASKRAELGRRQQFARTSRAQLEELCYGESNAQAAARER